MPSATTQRRTSRASAAQDAIDRFIAKARADGDWSPKAIRRRVEMMKRDRGIKRKPQPLPPDIQSRYDLLFHGRVIDRTNIDARVSRLLGTSTSARVDPIAAAISEQLKAQAPEHRPVLSAMYRTWIAYNELHFGGKLALPILTVRGNSALDYAQATCQTGKLPTIISFNKSLVGKEDRLRKILLHEMLHAALGELDPEHDWDEPTEGHGKRFAELANRIGRELGYSDCTVDPKRGSNSANYWPFHRQR